MYSYEKTFYYYRSAYNTYITDIEFKDTVGKELEKRGIKVEYIDYAHAQTCSDDIVAEGEPPVRVADSFSFTEGPAVDAKGDIYFTDQPNGIIETPDGKQLYVAEAKANRILRYDIQKNGLLANRQVFADMGSDGMTIDDRGNNGKGCVFDDDMCAVITEKMAATTLAEVALLR